MTALAAALPPPLLTLARYERVLPAFPAAVGQARALAVAVLAATGAPASVADDAALVASELVTNAVRVSAACAGAREILIRVTCGPAAVLIAAGDHGLRVPPAPGGMVAHGQLGGRGLHLVSAVSAQLAWYREGAWKIVWARLAGSAADAAQPADQPLHAVMTAS
jgi:anti-sigma regulatory factor (Ser/Thr protein kinase)